MSESGPTHEVAALVEAISWSNANLYFADAHCTDNSTDVKVAEAIQRGLKHLGWTLSEVPAGV